MRPNEEHCIPTITSDRLIAFNIHISAYYLWNVCTDFVEPDKIQSLIHSEVSIKQHFCSDAQINALVKKIWKLFHEDADCNRFKIRSYLLEFIKMISKEISVNKSDTDFSGIRLYDIQKAVNYIKQNYSKPITLDDIAHAATMSRSHLTNTFKLVTGTTPYEYLLTTRLEKASSLLIETNRSILQISYDCGFNNITNFNRAFKQKMGETPSALRLRHLQ